ncbi:hypothetical protein RFI_23781 [Reticulomyxa filosa]|uniref:Uncharacterized protein n=1 Tax=Reticulomyxa filosa TaxID=46433 RepID=X6MIU1_RETFI|nr:hypothetical protein RFI_23781 [Reticulomyxa filosa]|eukprot:ETO13586.1 hypothetical protein RFI_23781 [Reticulomyxa filosa]
MNIQSINFEIGVFLSKIVKFPFGKPSLVAQLKKKAVFLHTFFFWGYKKKNSDMSGETELTTAEVTADQDSYQRDRSISEKNYLMKEQLSQADATRADWIMRTLYILVVASFVVVAAIDLSFYFDHDKNSTTTTTFQSFESVNMPYFLFLYLDTLDFTILRMSHNVVSILKKDFFFFLKKEELDPFFSKKKKKKK